MAVQSMYHTPLVLFAASLICFHASEFCLALIYMRDELGWHSLLLSSPYVTAMGLAVMEYLVEASYFPVLKGQVLVTYLGLVLVVLGEVLRKTAMVTAGCCFTHHIRTEWRSNHQLVTHGIYKYLRHPGYLGWFLWSVGTQLMLVNPGCVVLFSFLSWKFFRLRIPYEEYTLRRLFGEEYVRYAQSTPTYLPFIS